MPENTREVVQVLGTRLRATQDKHERHLMLIALSNVGDLDLTLPLATPFLASENEDLRRAAFEVFRKAEGEPAFQRFAERYAAELAPSVRDAASGVAISMPDTAARAAWAAAESARGSLPVWRPIGSTGPGAGSTRPTTWTLTTMPRSRSRPFAKRERRWSTAGCGPTTSSWTCSSTA